MRHAKRHEGMGLYFRRGGRAARALLAWIVAVALLAAMPFAALSDGEGEPPAEATRAVESAAPKADTPKPEAAASEAATDAPATDVPATEAPATEAPGGDATGAPPADETPAPGGEDAPGGGETPEADPNATAVPATDAPTENPTDGPGEAAAPLKLTLSDLPRYGVVGERFEVTVAVSGGVAPYALSWEKESRTVEAEGGIAVAVTPSAPGTLRLKVRVVDGGGEAAEAEATLEVSGRERESRADWERTLRGVALTGDWAADLIAVARTQVGYRESADNFIIDESGRTQGYTRYGDWAGSAYEEWCAMFVSFCLNYANIGEGAFPRAWNCNRWKESLGGLYRDDEDAYQPRPGDLIFFHHNRENSPKAPNFPNHVGIVTRVTEDRVYTIEGNSGKSVREREYARGNASIVGYADLTRAERRAKGLPEADAPAAEATALPLLAGRTLADNVPLYAEASRDGELLGRILLAGTEIAVLERLDTEDGPWYMAEYEELTGYVPGDVLEVAAEAETPEPEPAREEQLVSRLVARTLADRVNVRAEAGVEGDVVFVVERAGTELCVLARAEADGEAWFLVEHEGRAGWVLGALLRLEERWIALAEGTLSLALEDGRTVAVSGMLPEGAELRVTALPPETAGEILAAGAEGEPLELLFAYDVSVYAHGVKYQPEAYGERLRVSVEGPDVVPTGAGELSLLHVMKDVTDAAGALDAEAAARTAAEVQAGLVGAASIDAVPADGGLSFELGSFSILIGGARRAPSGAAALQALIDAAPDGEETTLNIGDVPLDAPLVIPAGKKIIFAGGGTLTLAETWSGTDPAITIEAGASLTLDDVTLDGNGEKVSLQGNPQGARSRGTFISCNGELNLKSGAIKNICSAQTGFRSGMILIDEDGVFNMSGGSIEKNRFTAGEYHGIVCVSSGGSFNLKGGTIRDNDFSRDRDDYMQSGTVYLAHGSKMNMSGGSIEENKYIGVYMAENGNQPAEFTMTGGSIRNNKLQKHKDPREGWGDQLDAWYSVGYLYTNYIGGGVKMLGGKFVLDGGTISGNNSVHGGGVAVYPTYGSPATFIMKSGVIEGNDAYVGGGVFVSGHEDVAGQEYVSLEGGTISGNSAKYQGGGVYVCQGFTVRLKDAVITGNDAEVLGGGLWSCPTADVTTYITNGGAIYENDAGNAVTQAGDDIVSVPREAGHRTTLAERALGGGKAEYFRDGGVVGGGSYTGGAERYALGSADGSDRYSAPGEPVARIDTAEGNALKSVFGETTIDLAEKKARLRITGNSAGRGGGIGTNGSVIIGTSPDEGGVECTLKVVKAWDGVADYEDMAIRVALVEIYRGERYRLDTVTLDKDNGFSGSFTGLPAGEYAVEELEIPEGMEASCDKASVTFSQNGQEATVTITNAAESPKPSVNPSVAPSGSPTERPAPVPSGLGTAVPTPTDAPVASGGSAPETGDPGRVWLWAALMAATAVAVAAVRRRARR